MEPIFNIIPDGDDTTHLINAGGGHPVATLIASPGNYQFSFSTGYKPPYAMNRIMSFVKDASQKLGSDQAIMHMKAYDHQRNETLKADPAKMYIPDYVKILCGDKLFLSFDITTRSFNIDTHTNLCLPGFLIKKFEEPFYTHAIVKSGKDVMTQPEVIGSLSDLMVDLGAGELKQGSRFHLEEALNKMLERYAVEKIQQSKS